MTSYLLAASLLLVGAGCAPAAAPSDQSAEPSAAETAANIEAAKGAVADLAKTFVDDTWRNYKNEALNFSFDWPTKGKYTPRWEVKFLEDAQVKDGCYADEGMTISRYAAGEAEFCHAASTAEGATATDYYVTKVGSRYVLLYFTKDSAGLGAEFSWKEYRAHLDQIVSTFKVAK